MRTYKRLYIPGGCYFFTVVTYQRKKIFYNENTVQILRKSFRHIMQQKPFVIDAIVILPDHLHCIWQLPEGDSDFSSRWREIKKKVTKEITPYQSPPIWQPRFWEHAIRNTQDWQHHVNYIHNNPVKHGWAETAEDWPWSSYAHTLKKTT